jgi:hypothetical protein
METILGASVPVFIGLTIVLFGGFAFLAGQNTAEAWKPPVAILFNIGLLTLGSRFLTYALFGGPLLSLPGLVVDGVWLTLVGFAAFRMTQAYKMVRQYPWLYVRHGLFAWRPRPDAEGG